MNTTNAGTSATLMVMSPSVQDLFNAAYWASQPTAVQAFQNLNTAEARTQLATKLATQGYSIDVPIMVNGWDPYLVMIMRSQLGYSWVPSALQQPSENTPGMPAYGTTPAYSPTPPAGSIAVPPMAQLSATGANVAAILAAWYPPFNPPVLVKPSVTAGSADPVGAQSIGNIYLSALGDSFPSGAQFTDNRGTFQKYMVATPFGSDAYWELIQVAA